MKITKILFIALTLTLPSISWGAATNVLNQAGSDSATPERQQENAIQAPNNPVFGLIDAMNAVVAHLFLPPRGKGLQFKDPVASGGLTYSNIDDGEPGGFNSNEFGGDVGFDVDIYDGLIVGGIYQHIHRSGDNALATSERLDSDGVTIYGAKRFQDLINVGLAYSYASTEHRLTRSVQSNLDRESHGVTFLAGLSSRKAFFTTSDRWNWSTTFSYGHIFDQYDVQRDLQTGRFSWLNGLGFDAYKWLTIGGAFNYHFLPHQDTLNNATPRDDNYWTIGPRFVIYPTDRWTVTMDMDAQQGYAGVTAYTVRGGAELAF